MNFPIQFFRWVAFVYWWDVFYQINQYLRLDQIGWRKPTLLSFALYARLFDIKVTFLTAFIYLQFTTGNEKNTFEIEIVFQC